MEKDITNANLIIFNIMNTDVNNMSQNAIQM